MGRAHAHRVAFAGAAAVLAATSCAALTGVGDLQEQACVSPSCTVAVDGASGAEAQGDAQGASESPRESATEAAANGGRDAAPDATLTDAGGPADAGVDAPADADADAEAEAAPDPGIICGAIDCTAGTEKCCIVDAGASTFCTQAGLGCGTVTAALLCDDTADCPAGKLCCAVFVTMTDIDVDCLASCAGTAGQFCDPNAGDCPSGLTCAPTSIVAGYHSCQ
jgi:hypothetical protein